MAFFILITIFALGAIVGSFLNVAALRYNTGRSIARGRSSCFSCAKKLSWPELLPIASFIWLRGKCRSCRSKISWQYPITEITTGLLFLLISSLQFSIFNEFSFYFLFSTFYFLIIFSLLIVIAIYDYHHQIIPDLLVWLFNVLAFLNLFVWNFNNWNLSGNWRLAIGNFDMSGFLAGFILSSFFALLWLISRGRWMGLGDAKLALGVGWLLGLAQGITAVVLSFWIGALVGLFLLSAAKKKYTMKSNIAFGPFLAIGTITSFLIGETLLKMFLQ